MRTTLDLESTALEAARQLAAHRAQSLGKVVSELILKGLRSDLQSDPQSVRRVRSKGGFPVFPSSAAGKPITLDDVKRAEDDE